MNWTGKENKMDISFIIIELALMIFLIIAAGLPQKRADNRWRLIYAAPTFLALTLAVFGGFEVYHVGIYVAAALQIACLFLSVNEVRKKQILAVISAVMIVANLAFVTFSKDIHRVPYLADFEKGYETMKEHYVLTEEKGIDWDALYAKYEPMFREIDKTQDHVENYKAWQQFTGEFYDGHVGYRGKSDALMLDDFCKAYGNDYGLSLVRLSTGEFAAVNVEGYENSYSIMSDEHDSMGFFMVKDDFRPADAEANRLTLKNAGIKNGTIITKWNGKPIDEYFSEVNYYMSQYPVRENEEFYLPIYVAGIGKDMRYGETVVPGEDAADSKSGDGSDSVAVDGTGSVAVDITYLDENGEEKTISAPSLGVYSPRMFDTMCKIDDGVNITNLEWQEKTEDTYMIRISQMIYDQETYEGTDYTEMTDDLREKILALKEAGVKNIVFDLRKNGGGSPFFVEGIACLFAPKGEHISYYSAVINEETGTFERGEDGKYKMGVPMTYEGEDLWHDGNVILLVNAETVSAGDDMTYMMGDYPNVKVMGFTSTNSSCQAVTEIPLEAGGLSFSAVPNMFPDGEVAIDTFTDHVGRTPFDEKIPMDQEAINAIFDRGEDYLMDYAVDSF